MIAIDGATRIVHLKLVFWCPRENTRQILDHLFDRFPTVVGKIGDYDRCAFVSQGQGQYRPGAGTNPLIGAIGETAYVTEDKVEVVINDAGKDEEIQSVIKELKQIHPYDGTSYEIYRPETFN